MRLEDITEIMLTCHEEGHRARVGMHTLDAGALDGREISIDGRTMVNFSSCGFLGLEFDPRLHLGAMDALRRYGTQFSCSRSYMSVSLYEELESKLSRMLGRPAIATPSTTLGHLAALPALVASGDAIVLDQQVHASMQQAASLLKSAGVHVETVRHSRLDRLDGRLSALRNKHARVWYLADGVYSMYGDAAPFEGLVELLERHSHLHLYVDDAHGFGWTGRHGRGVAMSALPDHERIVFAASLNKSFAAAGGVLALPNEEMARRVRQAGRTLIFSGPIQPPMLGAAIASADLHLSEEIEGMQAELARKIALANEVLRAHDVPLAEFNETPVCFVPTGIPKVVNALTRALMLDGFQVSPGIFPAVPMARGGLRFTITRHQRDADIEALAERIAYHHPRILHDFDSSREDLARAFKTSGVAQSLRSPRHAADLALPRPSAKASPRPSKVAKVAKVAKVDLETSAGTFADADAQAAANEGPTRVCAGLELHVRRTIDEVDPSLWDGIFASRGPMSHSVQRAMEAVFAGNGELGQDFEWRYVWITDREGEVVAATFFSIGHIKDDSFAAEAVSVEAEAIRAADDPMHLVSKSVVSGSPLSLGDHLYLADDHPGRAEALRALVTLARSVQDEVGASQILLRDFEEGATASELVSLGFAEIPIPPMMLVDSTGWDDRETFLRGLSSKNRYSVRREILAREGEYELEVGAPEDPLERARCYDLYRTVHGRGRRLNVFPLPARALSGLMDHDEFDVLRLYAGGAEDGGRRLVAFLLSHVVEGRYTALLVGLDDAYREQGAYKQILFHGVQRGSELGARLVNLAFTAEVEKRKLGAVRHPRRVLVAADDDYAARAMMSMG